MARRHFELDLDDLPGAARIVFEQLIHPYDSGDDGADLHAAVDAHLIALERAAANHEFIELDAARQLTLAAHDLLEHAADIAPPAHSEALNLARAAVRYFILDEDADDDRGVGGLDDDIAVMRLVARALGCDPALAHLPPAA